MRSSPSLPSALEQAAAICATASDGSCASAESTVSSTSTNFAGERRPHRRRALRRLCAAHACGSSRSRPASAAARRDTRRAPDHASSTNASRSVAADQSPSDSDRFPRRRRQSKHPPTPASELLPHPRNRGCKGGASSPEEDVKEPVGGGDDALLVSGASLIDDFGVDHLVVVRRVVGARIRRGRLAAADCDADGLVVQLLGERLRGRDELLGGRLDRFEVGAPSASFNDARFGLDRVLLCLR